jgi:hypothetical protein
MAMSHLSAPPLDRGEAATPSPLPPRLRHKLALITVWIPAIILVATYVPLAVLTRGLPDAVPMHFDGHGSPETWGSPDTLLFTPGIIAIFEIFLACHTMRAASRGTHAWSEIRAGAALTMGLAFFGSLTAFSTLYTFTHDRGTDALGLAFLTMMLPAGIVALGVRSALPHTLGATP